MMKDVCLTEKCLTEKSQELKYSLIWAGLWIAALAALLLMPAFGR
jgi:hypothetical protein